MTISTKRRLGSLLVGISVLTAVICLAVGGHWPSIAQSGLEGALSGEWELRWQYATPIFVCGAIGVMFLAVSTRKPPKLPK